MGLADSKLDPWFPREDLPAWERDWQWHLARRVCATCPVRYECAVDGLDELPRFGAHGMRGGLRPGELVGVARWLGLPDRRVAEHGTDRSYKGGCRCLRCRRAHADYEHERRLWAKPRRTRSVIAGMGGG